MEVAERASPPSVVDPIDALRTDFQACGLARVSFRDDAEVMALFEAAAEDQKYYADAGYNRVQDAWRRSRAIRALAGLPAVCDRIRDLYGARPFPFQTLSFNRAGEDDASADTVHFDAEPADFLCGVMFALEDFAPESGLPYFFPGSHKEPHLALLNAGAPPGMDFRQAFRLHYQPAILKRAEQGYRRETVQLLKGEALIWAGNMTRGGSPITDPGSTQRSLVVNYFFEGCDYFTPLNSPPGRRWRRLPSDASRGRFVWPSGGLPSLRTIAFECWVRLVNRVNAFPN